MKTPVLQKKRTHFYLTGIINYPYTTRHMGYRSVAKWKIDMSGVQNAGGWREFFGVNHLSEEFGIKFREREIRFTVRTADFMTLSEIEHILPALARARYRYHHRYGTGN